MFRNVSELAPSQFPKFPNDSETFRKGSSEVTSLIKPMEGDNDLKKKGKELSVKKAAQMLNLSERTVLNFIKQKKIEAIKVGRDWFIDYASFVSFSSKYEFPISERGEVLSESFGNIPKSFEKNGDFSENAETFPKDSEKMEVVSERLANSNKLEISTKISLKRLNHITSLRVYELSKIVFSNQNFLNTPSTKLEERLIDLSYQALEAIGSGFYAYSWDEKKFYYSRARSSAGGLMALISTKDSLLNKWSKEGHELEEVLIPALGALIKTVEKKSLKEKMEGISERGKK